MVKKILLIFCVLLFAASVVSQNRFWVSNSQQNWSTNNWSSTSGGAPDGGGPPIATENANFDANGIGNCIIDVATPSISNLILNGYPGTIDLDGNTITATGTVTLASGFIIDGMGTDSLVVNSTGTTTFSGTIMGVVVRVSSPIILANGSSFQQPTTLIKNGGGNANGSGGNTFNSTLKVIHTGSGNFVFGNSNPDVFNGVVGIQSPGTGGVFMANGSALNEFRQRIELENSTAGGVYFGSNGGSATLSGGVSISIGPTGFSSGTLQFRNFTVLGGTGQTLNLTTSAAFDLRNSAWVGTNTFSAGQITVRESTFGGPTILTKTGAANNNSYGGNTFSGDYTMNNSGSGTFLFGNNAADVFNSNVSLNNSGTGRITIAQTGPGHTIAGNLTVNETGAGNSYTYIAGSATSTIDIAGDVTLNLAGSGGNDRILLGSNGDVTVAGDLIADNNSTATESYISIGDVSTSNVTINGTSTFNNMLSAGNDSRIYIGNNGTVQLNSTVIANNGSTSNNGYILFAFREPSTVTINGNLTGTNSGAGNNKRIDLGTSGDFTINGNTFLSNSATSTNSFIYCSEAPVSAGVFNGNITVESYGGSSDGIRFGGNGGTVSFQAGGVFSIGPNGFTEGGLRFRNFTQAGATPINITTTGTSIVENYNAAWGGSFTSESPRFLTRETTYNSTFTVTKTGAGDDRSIGANRFFGNAIINKSGPDNIEMGDSQPDTFQLDLIINNTGPDQISIADNSAGNRIEGKLRTFNNGTGNADVLISNAANSSLVINDSVVITNSGSGTRARTYFGNNGDIELNGALVANNISTANEALVYVANGTASMVEVNGNSTFTNNASSINSNIFVPLNGDVTYNGDVTLQNGGGSTTNSQIFIADGVTSTVEINGNLIGSNSNTVATTSRIYVGDDGNITVNGNTEILNSSNSTNSQVYLNDGGTNVYNGNIVLECNAAGSDGFLFGNGGGSSTLNATYTITIGALGYVSGELWFRNFNQVGSTAQTLLATGTTRMFNYNSDWGGDVNFSAPRMNTRETYYRGTATLSKTGPSGDRLFGANKFFGNTIVNNSGSAEIRYAETEPDTFLMDLTVNHSTSGGSSTIAYSSADNIIDGNLVVNHAGTANANVQICNNTGSSLRVGGNVTLNNNPTSGDGRIYSPNSGELSIVGDLTVSQNATSPTAYIYLASATSSSLQIDGNSTITNTSAGTTKRMYIGNRGDITFNGTVDFINSSTATNSQIYVNLEAGSFSKFNQNVTLQNTTATTDGILFGNNGGSDTLADGRTITIGGGGFVAGLLTLRNFIQLGNTSQTLVATGTAQMLHYDSEWNGNTLNFSSPSINSRGTTFEGVTTFSKTGAGNNDFVGGNTYVTDVTINNSGSARMRFGVTSGDIFGGDVTINHSASLSETSIAQSSSGNLISGNLVINHTSANATATSAVYVASGTTSDLTINGNATLNNTASGINSIIYFAENGDINLLGNLIMNNAATGAAGQITTANQTNAVVTIAGTTTINNSGTGNTKRVFLANNGRVVQNGVCTATNNASANNSEVYFGNGTASSVRFNENVVAEVTNASCDGIRFGNGGGRDTLAAGRTITIGGGGFISGILRLRNVVQLGGTPQSLTTTGTSFIDVYDSKWGGNITFTSPRLTTRGTLYSGLSTLTKTGATDDASVGGNTFALNTVLNNTGTDYMLMGNAQPDTFQADLTMNNTSSDHMYLAHNSAGNSISGNLLINNNGTGQSYVYVSTNNASALTVDGTTTINNLGSGANTRVYFGDNGDVDLNDNLTIISNPTGTNGYIYVADGANSTVTINGNTSIDMDGTTSLSRAYIGNSGDVTFNGDLEIRNRSGVNSSQFYLNHSANSFNTYNGNITIENPNASSDGIFFGNSAGAAVLTASHNISVGPLGFTGQNLFFRNFDQIGATAQTLDAGPNAVFTLYDCEWGGDVNFTSRGIITRGTTYDGTTQITKTGTTSSDSYGGNTFNGNATITNNSNSRMRFANNVTDDFNGNVTFVKTGGTLEPNRNANSTYAGDITLNSNSVITFGVGNGIAILDGTTAQSINNLNANEPIFRRLELDNAIGEVTLNAPITVSININFLNGNLITTDANLLSVNDNATATGANDNSYVYGPVEKIGNNPFTFPVGDSGLYRPISISAPVGNSDRFMARYFEQNTSPTYNHSLHGGDITNVSSREYWILDRTNGSSNVDVTLSWNTNSGGVGDLAELRVARWDGTKWDDEGNGGTTGNLTAGTVVSSAPVTNFSPFTLGSTSFAANPLPIELVSFNAKPKGEVVELAWETATEINNDYFTIERTQDGVNFEIVEVIKGAGNSYRNLTYKTIDSNPLKGTSYYRLKQTDYDGKFEYFDLKAVRFEENKSVTNLLMFPNPIESGNSLSIEWKELLNESSVFQLIRLDGKVVLEQHLNGSDSFKRSVFFPRSIATGVYVLKLVLSNGHHKQTRIIVR